MLTAAGANAGVLRGLPCLLGVLVGMGLMMFLVPLGLGSIVLQNPLVLKALHWGGAAVLLWMSEDRNVEPHRLGVWSQSSRLRWRSGLSVDQPQIVARERERGRDLSQRGGRKPDRAVRLPGRALRRGGIAELLSLARVRRYGPAPPPSPTTTAGLQRRDGGAARAVDRPDRLAGLARADGALTNRGALGFWRQRAHAAGLAGQDPVDQQATALDGDGAHE